MRIGINTLFFKYPASGSGQYLSYLLHALAEVDQQNEYVLVGPHPILPGSEGQLDQDGGKPRPYYTRSIESNNERLPQEQFPQAKFSYAAKPVPAFLERREGIEKVVWEQFTGPAAARKAGVDLFHIPYFAPPYFPRTPTVVTIHDVIPLRLPIYQDGTRMKVYMNLIVRAAHKATLIITVSQHAKQDIIDTLKFSAERIRVIYEAAGDAYHPVTDPLVLADVRRRYGVGERYILYLGGLDQRKNVPKLVQAFAY